MERRPAEQGALSGSEASEIPARLLEPGACGLLIAVESLNGALREPGQPVLGGDFVRGSDHRDRQ